EVAELLASATAQSNVTAASPLATGQHILLTGATGFLGAYLVLSLLRRRPATTTVLCLVRAEDDDAAAARLRRLLGSRVQASTTPGSSPFPFGASVAPRIVALAGDLARSGFGWSTDRWNAVAGVVGEIVHNGALVHWVYPYAKLRAPNVA